MQDGEYSVAETHLRRRERPIYKRLQRRGSMRWLAAFAQSLQICIKCRSFKFSEKMQIIRVEYGQKARCPTNLRFKACC